MAFKVELELAGSTWTLDDKHITVSDFTERLSLFGATPALSSASMEVMGLPLALLASQGHKIAGAVGRLYLDGDLLFTGTVSAPTYGAPTEPVFMSLREGAYQDTGLIPTATERVSDETLSHFGTVEDDRKGLYYPVILGQPGVYVPDTGLPVRATPAILGVETGTETIIIARGVLDVSSVQVWNDTTGLNATLSLVTVADGLGQTFTKALAPSAAWVSSGDELWAGYIDQAGPSSVYDVSAYLLRLSSLKVDYGALVALRALSWRTGSHINVPTSPWGWLKTNILPYVPVSAISTPRGLAFVVHDLTPALTEVAAALTQGTNAWRLTQVEIGSEDDVVNDIVVQFAPDYKGVYRGEVQKTDERSVALYGRKTSVVKLSATMHLNTAETTATYLLRRDAYPTMDVEYLTTETVTLGDLVRIDDPDVYFEDTLGWVTSRTIRSGLPTRVRIRLVPPATA